MEVIVPVDSSVDVTAQRTQFDTVQFVDIGTVATRHPTTSDAGQHELYDRRRAAGLAAATGELVALLEDRGRPRPNWARLVSWMHTQRPEPAIGGAIECDSPDLIGKAVYLCDFGRYGLPRSEGPSRAVSDTNVTYKRDALNHVREVWEERFHEPRVHAALRLRGGLWFAPKMVVDQRRDGLSAWHILAERFHWGRLFGAERCRTWGTARCLAYAAGALLLAPLLWLRLLAQRVSRPGVRGFVPALVVAVPLV